MNRLYEVKKLNSNSNRVIKTKHGSVVISENEFTINHSNNSRIIKELDSSIELINATSTDEVTYILCNKKANETNNIFIYCSLGNKEYSLLLENIKTDYDKNKYAIAVFDNFINVIGNGKYLFKIYNEFDDLSISSETGYLTSKVCNARIADIINLPKYIYSSFMIEYNKDLYIPIENTRSLLKIAYDGVIKKIDLLNLEVNFRNVKGYAKMGETTENATRGTATLVVNSNSLVMLDFEDSSGYVIEDFNYTDVLTINGETFIIGNEDLYLFDYQYYELFKVFADFEFHSGVIYEKDRRIELTNNTGTYRVNEVLNKSIVTINCIDGDGDIVSYAVNVYPKNGQSVKISAPRNPNYELVGESIKTIVANEDFITVEFNYELRVAYGNVNIYHKSTNGTILKEFVLRDKVNTKYNVNPIFIDGYSFSHSENSSGIVSALDTECNMYYSPTDSYIPEENYSYLNIKCISDTNKNINKVIPITKGNDISIMPVDVSYHRPKNNNAHFIGDISYNLTNTEIEYVSKGNVVIVEYYYNNILLFKDYALKTEDDIVFNPPSYISFGEINKENLMGIEDIIKLNVKVTKEVTKTNFVDNYNNNLIAFVTEEGTKEINNDYTIENYEFKNSSTTKKDMITINNLVYEKVLSKVKVYHIVKETNEVLAINEYTGKRNSTIEILEYKTEDLTLISDLKYQFKAEDEEIKIYYSKKKVLIKYNIVELNSNKSIKSWSESYDLNERITPNINIPDGYNVLYNPLQGENLKAKYNTEYQIIVYKEIENKLNFEFMSKKIKFSYNTNNLIIPILYKGNKIIMSNKKVYLYKSEFNINSTIDYLDKNNITYIMANYDTLRNLNAGDILINGDLSSKRISLIEVPEGVQYIPLNATYSNLKESINRALMNCRDVIEGWTSPLTVSAEIELNSYKYIKSTKKLITEFDIFNYESRLELYKVAFKTLKSDETIAFTNKKINVLPGFINANYYFSDTESGSGTMQSSSVSNINYKNNDDNFLIEKFIKIYFIDILGNRTNMISKYIQYYITDENTKDTTSTVIYKDNMIRVNHRYKGPRESLKFVNQYESINQSLKEMDKLNDEFKERLKHKRDLIKK